MTDPPASTDSSDIGDVSGPKSEFLAGLTPQAQAILLALAHEERHHDNGVPLQRIARVSDVPERECKAMLLDLQQLELVAYYDAGPGRSLSDVVMLTEIGKKVAEELALPQPKGPVDEFHAGLSSIELVVLDAVVSHQSRVPGGSPTTGHLRAAVRAVVSPKPSIDAVNQAIDGLVPGRLEKLHGNESSYRAQLAGLLGSSWGKNGIEILDQAMDVLRNLHRADPSLRRYSWRTLHAAGVPRNSANLAHLALTCAGLGNGIYRDDDDWWSVPRDLDIILEVGSALEHVRDVSRKATAGVVAAPTPVQPPSNISTRFEPREREQLEQPTVRGDKYRPYPVDLIGELEDLLHERACAVAPDGDPAALRRNKRIPEILNELSEYRPPRVGDVVAGAELLSIIDSGSFGTVWRGFRVDDRDPCAVKVFHSEGLGKGRMTREFRQGVGAMRALTAASPPANIVRLVDQDLAQLAFSMTLVEGGDLRTMERRGWTFGKKLEVFRELCSAVKFAHEHSVIHRDLKPANVLVDAHGHAVLTDFDLADLLTLRTLTARSTGSLAYAAPEQLEPPKNSDHAPRLVESDIYSLGRVLFYLVTGSDPSGVFRQEVPELPELADTEGLRRIVRRCTLKAPGKRYRSVDELVVDLDRFAEHPGAVGCDLPGHAPAHSLHEVPAQPVDTPPSQKSRPARKKGSVLARYQTLIGGVLGAAATLGAAGILLRGSPRKELGAPPTPTLTSVSRPIAAAATSVPAAVQPAAVASTARSASPLVCPDQCCHGKACDAPSNSCRQRWECELCRSRLSGTERKWRLWLKGVSVQNTTSWTELQACVVSGSVTKFRNNCAYDRGPANGSERMFDLPPADSALGHYIKVIGMNKEGKLVRIGEKRTNLRAVPESICDGFSLSGFESVNGEVVRVVLGVIPEVSTVSGSP